VQSLVLSIYDYLDQLLTFRGRVAIALEHSVKTSVVVVGATTKPITVHAIYIIRYDEVKM